MCYGAMPGGRLVAVQRALAVVAWHPRRGILATASGGKYRNNFVKVGV